MTTKLGLGGTPDAVEDGEIRLGSLALKSGWLTDEQLRRALSLQAEEALAGRTRLLGQILTGERLLTEQQLDELLRRQKQQRA